jgi:hypothetical protein
VTESPDLEPALSSQFHRKPPKPGYRVSGDQDQVHSAPSCGPSTDRCRHRRRHGLGVDTDHGTSNSTSFTQSVKEVETGVKSPYDLIRRVFSFRLPATYKGSKKTGQDAYVTLPVSAMTAWLESRIQGWPYSSLHRLPEGRALLEAAGPGGGLLEAIHFRRVANDEEGAPWEVQVRQLILATDGTKVPRALPEEALAPKDHVVIPRPCRRLVVSAVARTLHCPNGLIDPHTPIDRSAEVASRVSLRCVSNSRRGRRSTRADCSSGAEVGEDQTTPGAMARIASRCLAREQPT